MKYIIFAAFILGLSWGELGRAEPPQNPGNAMDAGDDMAEPAAETVRNPNATKPLKRPQKPVAPPAKPNHDKALENRVIEIDPE